MPSGLTDGWVLESGADILEDEYTVKEKIGSGNSGEVYLLSHHRGSDSFDNRVFKLFIPFYELRQAQLTQGDPEGHTQLIIKNAKNQSYYLREYRFLSRLDHPFVVNVYDHGTYTLTAPQASRLRKAIGDTASGTISLSYIITSYVQGTSFQESLRGIDRGGLLKVLLALTETLDYMHKEHDLLHLDIKSENIRVRADGYPVLIDFALAQDLALDENSANELVKGGIDWDLTPFRHGTSGVADFIRMVQGPGMSKRQFREEAFPGLDLYQVGLMLKECVSDIQRVLTPAEFAYFRSIMQKLTSWNQAREMVAGDLFDLIQRIDSTRFFLTIRPGSMSGGKEKTLSSPRKVFIPPKLRDIVEHPELTRLHRLNQLGLLFSEFPGATHSRYEHSLDVFRIAQSAARRLLDDPMCRSIFDERDVEFLVIAALLHDVNHLPLTHLYQESGVDLLGDRDLFRDALEHHHPGHESLADVVCSSLDQPTTPHTELKTRLHRLLGKDWEYQQPGADEVISSLINSGVDIDKMSYLSLDSDRSGLGFAAGLDMSRLLSSMRVVEWDKRDGGRSVKIGYHIAFPHSSLPLIEELVTARVRGFRELYWCNENRAMMAQFLTCTRELSAHEGGKKALEKLVIAIRGATDFAVLDRLDDLAQGILNKSFNLSALFDSLSATRPELVYSSTQHWSALAKMDANSRLRFEEDFKRRLRDNIIAERAIEDDADTDALMEAVGKMMIDVPLRELGLGGNIVVIMNPNGDDVALELVEGVDASGVLDAQQKELQRLSTQIRIFAPRNAVQELTSKKDLDALDDMDRLFGQTIRDAIGGSTLK